MLIPTLKIIFWLSGFSVLHTYFFYPLIIHILSLKKKNNNQVYEDTNEMPEISVIMAVRNAENAIEKKIRSVFENEYELDKINFFIGSDASDDNTDDIIRKLSDEYPKLIFTRFNKRVGKIKIINELEKKTKTEILVFTDVHAFLDSEAIKNLVKHFKNPEIKVVCGKIKNSKPVKGGISTQENFFLEREFDLKFKEGKTFGTAMGAYGALYAIRKNSFSQVPHNFIVDDFYITLKAIAKEGMAICDPKAIVYQSVTASPVIEFQRKIRISTGNFQNLSKLLPVLLTGRKSLMFCFFSHKILRWFTPIFIIAIFVSSFFLLNENLFYYISFIIITLSFIIPIIDFFCRKIQIHVLILRSITHFYHMNLALLLGMFKFMKGVNTNVWEPTNRE